MHSADWPGIGATQTLKLEPAQNLPLSYDISEQGEIRYGDCYMFMCR